MLQLHSFEAAKAERWRLVLLTDSGSTPVTLPNMPESWASPDIARRELSRANIRVAVYSISDTAFEAYR